MEYDMFLDKEFKQWTGIRIFTRGYLYIPYTPKIPDSPIKGIHINPPTYRIDFAPNLTPDGSYTVIEVSTFKRAKKLAEEYYTEWCKVNNKI